MSRRRYVVEVDGLDDQVSDEWIKAALAAAVSEQHRLHGGAKGLAVGTSGGTE